MLLALFIISVIGLLVCSFILYNIQCKNCASSYERKGYDLIEDEHGVRYTPHVSKHRD